jgi:adenylate cyclase
MATRRLAAVPAADVTGYSPLISADWGGTLKRLAAIQAEATDPRIAEQHGRIVKTMGDGLSWSSAVSSRGVVQR